MVIYNPCQLFPQLTWLVHIWPQHSQDWGLSEKFNISLPYFPSLWIGPPNWLFDQYFTQPLTLANFFHPQHTWPVYIWPQHSHGEDLSEKYNLSLPFHPLPVGRSPKLTSCPNTQSLTLANFFHKILGQFIFDHKIARVKVYQKNSTSPCIPPLPIGRSPQKLAFCPKTQSLTFW